MNDTLEPRFTLTDDPVVMLRRMRAEGTLDASALTPEARAKLEAADERDAVELAMRGSLHGPANGNGKDAGANGKNKRQASRPSPRTDETPAAKTEAAPGEADPDTHAIERDQHGCYVKGNKGGPGNPFGRTAAHVRYTFLKHFTTADIEKLADHLLTQALEGNVHAAKLVLNYTIGKPTPAVDVDRLDSEEWDLFKATSGMLNEINQVMIKADPEFPLGLVRTTRPAATDHFARMMGYTLLLPDKPKKKLFDKLLNMPPREAERELSRMAHAYQAANEEARRQQAESKSQPAVSSAASVAATAKSPPPAAAPSMPAAAPPSPNPAMWVEELS